MNIPKLIGVATAAIPIGGLLIGGITFGLTFKTDVQNIKDDVKNQQQVNADVQEWFSSLPGEYDDTQLWVEINKKSVEINNLNIPEAYNDSSLTTRLQKLALDLASLSAEVDNIEVGDTSELTAQVAELSGQLKAMSNIDLTSDDGSVDLGPLVVRIATAEGSMDSIKTSITTLKSDIRTVKTDITGLERASNSTSSPRYDDSNLRSRISTVERQVNSLPTTSSSGSTVQRVENPFNDDSLRSDISALQTAIAVLQASPGQSYDDSDLRDRIDDIQYELENIDIPTVSNNATDTEWLEELIHNVKDELSWRIDELEWASDTTTTSDDMYAEKWRLEDLQYEVMYIQEQVWELQTLVNDSNDTIIGSNTTTSTSVEGGANANPHLYIHHNQDSYTGDYWLNEEYNGHPLWINWECGNPGSQFEYCYIYRHPVGFTSSGWVWVIQPIPPSDEWSANAYTDGRWPWKKEWSGDVNSVEVMN